VGSTKYVNKQEKPYAVKSAC